MNAHPISNLKIPTSQLPRWEEIPFEPISPRYKILIWINGLITWALMAGAIFALVFWGMNQSLLTTLMIVAAFTVLTAIYLVFNLFSFSRRGYALREQDVLYQAGVFRHYTLIIPFKHIQHVRIGSTLISRALGLVAIDLFTAGSGRDMRIAGLDRETGQMLQQYISTRISHQKTGDRSLETN